MAKEEERDWVGRDDDDHTMPLLLRLTLHRYLVPIPVLTLRPLLYPNNLRGIA